MNHPALVFWEPGFPWLDTRPIAPDDLPGERCGLDRLAAALAQRPGVFINPYGSAFPADAWRPFLDYLRAGGRWLNLGGSPLSRPVRRNSDGGWRTGEEQRGYAQRLLINQAFPIPLSPAAVLDPAPPGDLRLTRAWALQVRGTNSIEFSDEPGSEGAREMRVASMVEAREAGRHIVSPVIELRRWAGEFPSGRWVLAACEPERPFPAAFIRALTERALAPEPSLALRASLACYRPGETPTLHLQSAAPARVTVWRSGSETPCLERTLESGSHPAAVEEPGLYLARATGSAGGTAETGFWVSPREALEGGKPWRAAGDLFEREGRPFPVTGTTYMSGESHRRFLLEPNVANWDTDFARMKAGGVNLVRTGLWTGWRSAADANGAVREEVLRALEAFLLTARRHDIPVIFNFFAFTPPLWGGVNPYLDPRSVAAQQAFVGGFAERFAGASDLAWDFINEPSFCSPQRLWSCRPSGDAVEAASWRAWLASQDVPDAEWRDRWRLPDDAPLALPALADFDEAKLFEDRCPLRVLDYRRFAQARFNEWLQEMTAAVRAHSSQMVSVGQDEAGCADSPNPHFHGGLVDFTNNHTWWKNGDLLWDALMTKTPGRPHLIGETGVMFGEGVDRQPWRSLAAARNLLERKMILSFAGGGAGFVQWLWNTNIYLKSDNEAGIGFHFADGAEKPELQAFREVSAFFAANADKMRGRQPEPVCVVIPHSHLFSARNHATAATQRAVRLLECRLGLPCRTASEYRPQDVGDARLIVLPCARVLREDCWTALLERVAAGATLLATGFIEADPYFRFVPRLAPFGLQTVAAPVLREESAETWEASFEGEKLERVDKAVAPDGAPIGVTAHRHGRGTLLYCPLPIELAQAEDAAAPLYRQAAGLAGLQTGPSGQRLLLRSVVFAQHTLYLMINESSKAESLSAWTESHPWTSGLSIPPDRSALAFVDHLNPSQADVYLPEN